MKDEQKALATTRPPKAKPPAVAPKSVPFDMAAMASQADMESALQGLTTPQRERVDAVLARPRSRGQNNDMKLRMVGEALNVSYSHPKPDTAALLLMADLGTMDPAFFSGVTGQIARIGAQGAKIDETTSNFLLSVVRAVQPRDELETLLAVQMGAIHAATMMLARRLNHVQNLPQQDAAERAPNAR